ncbi:MAG: archaemetzincin family Zn-dependent metalloprotease [Nitrososphaeria archaeon]
MKIVVIALNDVDKEILNYVCKYLRERVFDCECVVDSSLELGLRFYNSVRKQYNSDLILEWIKQNMAWYNADVIVGIGDFDAYANGLNFIFGEAYPKNRVCSVYLERLKTEDRDFYNERIIKEVIHEIGHVLGLQHCGNPECIMYFSRTIADTDRKKPMYCKKCSQLLLRDRVPLKIS